MYLTMNERHSVIERLLLILYKRGVVILGVVSLTMGNSGFPFGNRLS